jgi:peptide deformylase
MKRDILRFPDQVLLTKSHEVDGIDNLVRRVCEDLVDTAKDVDWGKAVGLAAPQIGVNWRIFLALGEIYINPRIVGTHGRVTIRREGCYSLEPRRFDYMAPRFRSITISWIDLKGEKHTKRFHRYDAQVIQHEMEHLDGVLCGSEPQLQKAAVALRHSAPQPVAA